MKNFALTALAFVLVFACVHAATPEDFIEYRYYAGVPVLGGAVGEKNWVQTSEVALNSLNYTAKFTIQPKAACAAPCIILLSQQVVKSRDSSSTAWADNPFVEQPRLQADGAGYAIELTFSPDTMLAGECGREYGVFFSVSIVGSTFVNITSRYFPFKIPCEADVLIVGNSNAFSSNHDTTFTYLSHTFNYDEAIIAYVNLWGSRGNTSRYVDFSVTVARNSLGLGRNPDLSSTYREKSYDELSDDDAFGRNASRRFVPIVRAARNKVKPKYIIIAGGNTVIPMPFALDPSELLSRGILRSDDPYASLDGGATTAVVSRLLTPEYRFESLRENTQNQPNLLIREIVTAKYSGGLVRDSRILVGDACGTEDSNACFLRAYIELEKSYFASQCTTYAGEETGGIGACYLVPNTCRSYRTLAGDTGQIPTVCSRDDMPSLFSSASFYLINLHGALGGEQVAHGPQGEYVLYEPMHDAAWLDFSILNPVVVTESCWGGRPDETRLTSSFAMQSLGMGARAFVGQAGSRVMTTLADAAQTPVGDAEIRQLLRKFVNERTTIGEAYLAAKQAGYESISMLEMSESGGVSEEEQQRLATLGQSLEHPAEMASVHNVHSLDSHDVDVHVSQFYNTFSMVLYGDPGARLS